ncbi:uncharacterized protein LOC122064950 [Macadamia integrifolia]|uniref:uncharacterized protein LOC122064950 n=1 Tax=Macadamia integrifolia TaxID=60698 RepID=UPI001C4F04C2|nr:uncharacterized protein LOC122064950 [Macadamia integrifolia]
MAGTVELVRSVISGIPNHNFAIYWWPSTLLVTMERWMKNFIEAGEVDTSKPITMKWEFVYKPKKEGGLGTSKGEVKSIADIMCCRKLVLKIDNPKFVPPLEVHWCKPPDQWIKINVDGSSLGNPGRTRVGGIVRDKNGQVCKAFSTFLGVKKIYEAEFSVVTEAILVAMNMNTRGLWIESDSAATTAIVSATQKLCIPWFVSQK